MRFFFQNSWVQYSWTWDETQFRADTEDGNSCIPYMPCQMPETDQSGKLRYPSLLTVVLMAILEEQKPSERKQQTSVSVFPRTGQK